MRPLVGALVAGLLLLPTPARGQTADAQQPPPEIIAREPLRDLLLHPEDLRHADTREMPDGYPLFAQQVPRFIEPTHEGEWGFDDFLVLGDYPTVTFWHYDRRFDQGLGERETWHRTGTRTILGRLVSVFRPRWPASTLRELLGKVSWGVDTPSFMMGRIGVPGSTRRLGIRVTMAPPNVPESQVIRINDDMQFASHVVNIRDPDFKDLRIQRSGNHPRITRPFYEHFADEYEVISIINDAQQIGPGLVYHAVVKNDISGIGMEVFDRSAVFGSAGVLQAYEGYPGTGFWTSVFHEQGHQYGEHSKVWDSLSPPLVRKGWNPEGHTPLLYPGAMAYGAVLHGIRRVGRVSSPGQPDRFEIEATLPIFTFHPLTLYRMGVIPPSEVPDMLVFHDQGQFSETSNTSPPPGTPVTGGTTRVTIDDLIAADGVREGPVVRRLRRAHVFVSRGELASQATMNVLNYLARRVEARSGVTTWDRYPSFFESTLEQVEMPTRIYPLHREPAQPSPRDGRCAKVATTALVGIKLDQEVGGCLTTGDRIRVSGQLTLTDRDDYERVCINFQRYPRTEDEDRVRQCAPLDADNRFAAEVTFRVGRPGGYRMHVSARWPDSGRTLSIYTGAIELYTEQQPNHPPAAARELPDLVLTLPDTRIVDVLPAFIDPDGHAMTYTASSSASHVVTASAEGGFVTLAAVSGGTATIRVTAADRRGSGTQTFTVAVVAPGEPFTDDPIRPGVTPIRAIHFMELRARIDLLRESGGLERFRWTDAVLRAGTTPVGLVHLTELRSALAEAYTAAGRSAPRWTDGAPVAGTTPIRAVHVTELRDAVAALE